MEPVPIVPFTRLLASSLRSKFDGVFFDLNVGEILDAITQAARVAVDALMLAAAIQIHVVFQPEPVIGLFHVRE